MHCAALTSPRVIVLVGLGAEQQLEAVVGVGVDVPSCYLVHCNYSVIIRWSASRPQNLTKSK